MIAATTAASRMAFLFLIFFRGKTAAVEINLDRSLPHPDSTAPEL